MKKWGSVVVGACLILGGCANNNAVVAQARPANGAQAETCKQSSVPQVASHPGYRQLSISLDSSDSNQVELSKNDLKIRDPSREIAVQFFQQEPASVGILVDTSGSMEPKMRQAEATLTDLIDGLSPDDEAFLMTFSSRTFLLQNFTTDHALLKQQMSRLHAFGQTIMRDAIIQGLLLVRQGCYQNKALFVMTDGMDNTSSASQSEMIAAVRESKVRIFALGIGNKQARPLFSGRFMIGGDEEAVDAATLQDLAGSSGGKVYILPVLGDAEAKKAALAIGDEIDNHYAVGFVATANSKIQIELLNHPGATLKIEGAPADVVIVGAGRP